MPNQLVQIPSIEVNQSYAAIVRRYEDDLTHDQLLALPYLTYGVSVQKTAELLGISKETLQTWMRTNEMFRAAMGEMAGVTAVYHQEILNQIAIRAWDVIAKSLDSDSDVPQAERMKNARFVIEQLGLKTNRIQVDHNVEVKPEVNVSDGSLELIAQRIHQLSQGISPNLDIVDGRYRTLEIEPVVACHPETTFGVINLDEEGNLQCHVCGKWFYSLVDHLDRVHAMTQDEYRKKYMIDDRVFLEKVNATNSKKD